MEKIADAVEYYLPWSIPPITRGLMGLNPDTNPILQFASCRRAKETQGCTGGDSPVAAGFSLASKYGRAEILAQIRRPGRGCKWLLEPSCRYNSANYPGEIFLSGPSTPGRPDSIRRGRVREWRGKTGSGSEGRGTRFSS